MDDVMKRDEWAEAAITELRRYGYTPIRVQDFTRADVVAEHGDRCFYCDGGDFANVAHFVELIDGGEHTLANARPCCIECSDHHSRW